MKKEFLFGFLIISAIIFSCRKKYDFVDGNNQNPTSYILKKETWSGSTTNGEAFAFFYNNDRLVSRIERYQWGTYSVNGGPPQTWYDTSYYTFEYVNGLCKKSNVKDGGADGYFVYEYNNKNLPVKRTCYHQDNTIQYYTLYKYDTADNLIEKVDSSIAVNYRSVCTYDNDGNLLSLIYYQLWSTPQKKSKYEWPTFDHKVNFIKAVNGLPVTIALDNGYGSYSSLSPNNFQSENFYPPVDIDQPFTSPISYSYSYEYNNEGLPVKIIDGPWTISFEYEKYR